MLTTLATTNGLSNYTNSPILLPLNSRTSTTDTNPNSDVVLAKKSKPLLISALVLTQLALLTGLPRAPSLVLKIKANAALVGLSLPLAPPNPLFT
jgi:hypothetical protein